MPFVQVIHWKPEEAAGLVEACRASGVEAECRPLQMLRQRLPDAVVIDLTRLPKSVLPDAIFTPRSRLRSGLQSALRKGAQNAALPPPAMVRFGGRTAAQKIGIKAGMKVAAIDAVAGYEELLGALPHEVEFLEDPVKPQDLTLWFIHDFDGLLSSLLKAGGEVGLALSKLCAVNDTWSAVWLVQRKVGK